MPCARRLAWMPIAASLAHAAAARADVAIACARLSAAETTELQARARLALAAAPTAQVLVECDAHHATLVYGATRIPIDESHGLVEGTLDALESHLAPAPAPSAPPAPSASSPSPSPALPPSPSPSPSRPPPPPPPRPPPPSPSHARGGLGLALSLEPWHSAGTGVGPRFDLALPLAGPFALVATESARFDVAPSARVSASLVDVQAGVGVGALADPSAHFGAVVLFGAERFGASQTDDTSSRSASLWTATADVGARLATRAGPIELWIGLDAIARAVPLELGAPYGVAIPRVTGMLSAGGFYAANGEVR